MPASQKAREQGVNKVTSLRTLTLLLIHWQGFPSRLNQLFEDLQSDILGYRETGEFISP
jgi:hypothetical protein